MRDGHATHNVLFLIGVLLLSATGCSTFARPHVSNVPDKPAALQDQSRVPYPVILVHGLAGFSNFGPLGVAYFNDVEQSFKERGVVVSAPPLPPYQSSEVRARYLAAEVDTLLANTGAEKVHLIGHSQGGLDARYLVNVHGYGDRVATITTISTPHRGTPVADRAQAIPPPALQAVFWVMAGINGAPPGVDLGEIDAAAALDANSTGGTEAFNEQFQDDPRVPIFSIAAVVGRPNDDSCQGGAWGPMMGEAAPQLWLTPTWALVSGSDPEHAVANDGVVPASSARWGTFLGCIPVDHVQVVGAQGALSLQSPNAVEFDQGAFFLEYLDRLRALEHGASAEVMTASRPRALPRADDNRELPFVASVR